MSAELRTLISQGDDKKISALAQENPALLSEPFSDGLLPIHVASQSTYAQVLQVFLTAEVDINAKCTESGSYNGYTALHFAAGKNNIPALNALLKGGADVNAPSDEGWTPLHVAAFKFKLDAMKALLQGGANVNSQNKDGQTPLFFVCASGRMAETRCLLEAGANANVADHRQNRPLHYAFQVETAKLLQDSYALPHGQLDIIVLLVLYGAEVDAKNGDGEVATAYVTEQFPTLTAALALIARHREKLQTSSVKWNYLTLVNSKKDAFEKLGLGQEEAHALKETVEQVECERLLGDRSKAPAVPAGHPSVEGYDGQTDISGGKCPFLRKRAKEAEEQKKAMDADKPLCPFSVAFLCRHRYTFTLMAASFAAGMLFEKRRCP